MEPIIIGGRCTFYSNSTKKNRVFFISEEEGIIFDDVAEVAMYLAKAFTNDPKHELRFVATEVIFANVMRIHKTDSGKYAMEWISQQEPSPQFLALQKQFHRIMDLMVFA